MPFLLVKKGRWHFEHIFKKQKTPLGTTNFPTTCTQIKYRCIFNYSSSIKTKNKKKTENRLYFKISLKIMPFSFALMNFC
jgi:hypothetical protein